jgi:hypothetical protein
VIDLVQVQASVEGREDAEGREEFVFLEMRVKTQEGVLEWAKNDTFCPADLSHITVHYW